MYEEKILANRRQKRINESRQKTKIGLIINGD